MKSIVINIGDRYQMTIPNVNEQEEQILADAFKKCEVSEVSSIKGQCKMLIKEATNPSINLVDFLNWG